MPDILSALQLLLLPPMLFPVLAAGFVCCRKKPALQAAKASLLLFLILSLPATANKLAQYWETLPPLQPERLLRFSPQAIVVIGGGLDRAAREYGGEATVKPGALLRLRYAAKLARETGLPVLVSGGPALKPLDVSEAVIMAAVLREEFGVPAAWQETESLNTAENARFSRPVLQRQGIDRIILVTQAYHMPRAALEFRKAGFQVLAAPTAFMGRAGGFALFDWLPSVKALEQVFLLAHESAGMLWYRLRY